MDNNRKKTIEDDAVKYQEKIRLIVKEIIDGHKAGKYSDREAVLLYTKLKGPIYHGISLVEEKRCKLAIETGKLKDYTSIENEWKTAAERRESPVIFEEEKEKGKKFAPKDDRLFRVKPSFVELEIDKY